MGLDERLVRFKDDLAVGASPQVDLDGALQGTEARRRRRHRHRRGLGLGVLAAVALAMAAVAVPWVGDEPESVVTGDGPSAPQLEAAPADEPHLWVSAAEVPRATAELAVAIANPTDAESATFGVGGELERWDGAAWEPHRRVRLCVDDWLCRGDLVRPGDELEIESVGLFAPPRGVGPTLWLPVADLDVGSYRLTIDGNDRAQDGEPLPVTAAGRFDVVAADGVDPLPPPRPLDGPGLATHPPIVDPLGGAVQLGLAGEGGSSAEMDSLWRSVVDPPVLERWSGTGWEQVQGIAGLDLVGDDPITREVDLPAVDAGAYRIVARLDDGAELEGRLWVEDVFDDGEEATSPSTTPASDPVGMPGVPLVLAVSDRLELWDGETVERVRVLTTAGEGRPPVPEGYHLGPVSLGTAAVWFTEYAGPEDRPSIWRLDLATGQRTLAVDDAAWPAISPDGTRLAYATGVGEPPYVGLAQQIGIVPVGTDGESQVIGRHDAEGEPPFPATIQNLEWSPDGTRLVFADRYENDLVGVLDPSTSRYLSDAVFLADENVAPTWVDDETIATGQFCCYAEEQRPLEYVLSDARSGQVTAPVDGVDEADARPLAMAADPSGRLLVLTEVTDGNPVGLLAVPSGDGAIEIEGVRSADW
jgi:hypothetical protein